MQRLNSRQERGHQSFRSVTAEDFGFDYSGRDPTTIPNVRLWHDTGQLQLHVAPFVDSEHSAQTTLQLGYDLELRHRGQAVRAGLLAQQGSWPFSHTENHAGSFSFPSPPEPPSRFRADYGTCFLLPGEVRVKPLQSRSCLQSLPLTRKRHPAVGAI